MKFFVALFLSLSSIAFADDYESIREEYLYNGPSPQVEKRILNLAKKDKKDTDNLLFLTNYYSWNGFRKKELNASYVGFKRARNNPEYKMIFWDHFHRNNFFAQASYMSGSRYNSTSIFLESDHNYDINSKDWLLFNLNLEYRDYHVQNGSSNGTSLGIGWVHFFRRDIYLVSFLNLSPEKSFMPLWGIDEELFISDDNDTYSLGLRYNQYESSNTLTLSPHWRHDFDNFYVGGRLNLVFTDPNVLTYYKVYLGHKINYRWSHEAGVTWGSSKEDGLRIVDFYSLDYGLKYKWSHNKEVGVKYNYYDSSYMVNHTTFLNFLYKY